MSTQKHKHHGAENVHHESGLSGDQVREGIGPQSPESAAAQADDAVPSDLDSQTEDKGKVPGAELSDLKSELLAAREEISALNDKYLRKLADEVNFRKRMAKDKDDARRFALNGFLADIVPVLDDFDRALTDRASLASEGMEHLRNGVILIRRQLGQMLENKYGMKRMASVDQPFDPNVHEAVGMEMGDTEEPVVCEEYLPGYVVEDRVIRTAKVKVRMPAPKTSPASPPDASDAGTDSSVADSSVADVRNGDPAPSGNPESN